MKILSKLTIDSKLFILGLIYLTILICAVPVISSKIENNKTISNAITTNVVIKEESKEVNIKKDLVDLNDITKKSGLTSSELSDILKGTIVEKDSYYLVDMESKYDINALFLASIFIHQGDANRIGNTIFSNDKSCIEFTAKLLHDSYLNSNGVYYNGKSAKGISIYFVGQNNSNNFILDITNIINNLI